MDLGSLFLILALTLIVLVLLSRPFLEGASGEENFAVSKESSSASSGVIQHSTLLAEQDRILSFLEELDDDHEMGKIPADEYSARRTALLKSGALVMKKLDELSQQISEPVHDDLEELIQTRRESRQTASQKDFCSQCGNPLQAHDLFCSGCGEKIDPH